MYPRIISNLAFTVECEKIKQCEENGPKYVSHTVQISRDSVHVFAVGHGPGGNYQNQFWSFDLSMS